MTLFYVPLEALQELPPHVLRIYCALCALRDAGYPPTNRNVRLLLGLKNRQYVMATMRHLDNLGWAEYYPYRGCIPRDKKREPSNNWNTLCWHKPPPSPNTPIPGS